jgi:hypothetical protein
LALALALCSAPRSAQAELDAQTQLSCLLGSGDLSSNAGAGVAATGEGLDLERWASRRSGRENRLRLTSSLEQAGYLPGVSTAARLSLELDLDALASDRVALRDASSFLDVAWQTGSLRLALRAYPLDTDEWRLGYLHALDWGGTDRSRGESIFVDQEGGVPGARLELGWPSARLFSGVKWARASQSPLRDAEKSWGFLSGGSFALSSSLRAELGFGYFEREASFVEGVSMRAAWHRGVDEPELATEPFRPPTLRDEARRFDTEAGPGAALALEGVALAQRARGSAGSPAAPLALAPGAALYGSWRGRALAAHGALTWRSLELVLRNARGGGPGQGVPASAALLPELAAWFGASVTVLPARLVPSLELGCLLPAALESVSSLPGLTQTFVVRDAGGLAPLPLGAGRLPIFASRVGLRFQASSALGLAAFVTYERDANRSVVHSRAIRVFAKPDRVHVTSAAWARF